MTKSRSCSRSCSCSPSPIKDISQPLINSNFKIQSESPNQTNKFIYRNDNTLNTKANTAQNMNYDDNYKYNDYINNIYTQKIRDNEVSKNNNSFINNNEETNNLTAKAFDEYMSKLAMNKYNRMNKYNESYYLKKRFGEDINNNFNYNNMNNNDNNLDELQLMRKNLEEKYKLYNLITKYDEMNFNNNNDNDNEDVNKENLDENSKEINKEENISHNKEIKNIKSDSYHKHYSHHKKHSHHKEEINDNYTNKNYERNYYKDKNRDYNSYSSRSESESSIQKKKRENSSSRTHKNDRNVIQKAYDENIGKEYNNNYIHTSDNRNIKKPEYNKNNKINNNINNNDNIDNSNLLEFLKKENEALKKLNNSYKQILDTLFYFLNNISRKYQKPDKNSQNNLNSPELFDLSKDLKNTDGLSQKLINLEFLMNDKKGTNPNNKNN